mgnify:CR=1 FL=1
MPIRTIATTKNKKRLIITFVIFVALMVGLCFRVGYIQIVKSDDYTQRAMKQQTKDEVVEAKRGVITDRYGQELAASVTCYSVWIRPAAIATGKTKELKEAQLNRAAHKIADITGTSRAKMEDLFAQKKSLIKVAKYLSREKADKVRKAGIDGVSLTEQSKRSYPAGNFASHVLGSVTDDNSGLSGLELYYNSYLKGVPGRWIQAKDVSGNPLLYGEQKYYKAQDGDSIELTIDSFIQLQAEEAIKKTYNRYKAKRVSCVVMNPKNGEILAMASTPGFDPNNSREPRSADKSAFKAMNSRQQLNYLNKMWRNPLTSDTYVPGSTFKLLTTSMALEEDKTTLNEHFYDKGYIDIAGTRLKCWRYTNPHGSENLEQAVGNSCNPVFAELATRLGINKFYAYLDLFGITERTGIDYPGEATSQLQNIKTAGPVGIATMGYGQGIAVTPIQLITAEASFGNGGMMMQPHLVKKITDSQGKTVKEFKAEKVRQTVSAETSKQICRTMEYVVNKGGAEKAQIKGYRVGGKTGTSNEEANGNKITASFIGMAPMDDPQMIILYIVERPQGEIYGSTVAAPGAREVMEKSLRHLKIQPN